MEKELEEFKMGLDAHKSFAQMYNLGLNGGAGSLLGGYPQFKGF